MRHAKIVATFGPSTASYHTTRQLLEAGVDVARLNMSHGDHQIHRETYDTIRQAATDLNQPVAIFADLQGPKIRTGTFENGPHELTAGQSFTITTDDVPGTAEKVSTTFKGLPADVSVGDQLLVDDGKIQLRATEVTDTEVICEVMVGGEISNHKGINLPGVAVNVPALTDKDQEDLRWALDTGVDMIALSFVRNAADIELVHQIMDEKQRRIPVIAKLEKPQAIDNLQDIVDAFDAIMVARGDLGVELPLEDVPVVQKRAIEMACRWAKPVIVATQVLESMIENPRPTRAEASDCANAVLDGADAVMLSGETSIGKYPVETVRTMSEIITSTEVHGLERIAPLGSKPRTRGGAVTRAAVNIAERLEITNLVCFTQSGDSAHRLSRLRPEQPIYAFTHSDQTHNQLCLTWGVTPRIVPFVNSTDQMTAQVDAELIREGVAEPGELVIIVAGSPPGKPGTTNMLKVHCLGDVTSEGSVETSQEPVSPAPRHRMDQISGWSPL